MNCPFCGFADRHKCVNWKKVNYFECASTGKETILLEPQYKKWRNEACKDRQIAQLQERLEAWREAYKATFLALPNAYLRGPDIQKLKDLGEIYAGGVMADFLDKLEAFIDSKIELALAEIEPGADGYTSTPVEERRRVAKCREELKNALVNLW